MVNKIITIILCNLFEMLTFNWIQLILVPNMCLLCRVLFSLKTLCNGQYQISDFCKWGNNSTDKNLYPYLKIWPGFQHLAVSKTDRFSSQQTSVILERPGAQSHCRVSPLTKFPILKQNGKGWLLYINRQTFLSIIQVCFKQTWYPHIFLFGLKFIVNIFFPWKKTCYLTFLLSEMVSFCFLPGNSLKVSGTSTLQKKKRSTGLQCFVSTGLWCFKTTFTWFTFWFLQQLCQIGWTDVAIPVSEMRRQALDKLC